MRQLWMAVIVAVTIILLVGCEEARPTTEKLLGTCKGTAKEDLKRFKIEVEPLLKKLLAWKRWMPKRGSDWRASSVPHGGFGAVYLWWTAL